MKTKKTSGADNRQGGIIQKEDNKRPDPVLFGNLAIIAGNLFGFRPMALRPRLSTRFAFF
jgi:hypothetical protein